MTPHPMAPSLLTLLQSKSWHHFTCTDVEAVAAALTSVTSPLPKRAGELLATCVTASGKRLVPRETGRSPAPEQSPA